LALPHDYAAWYNDALDAKHSGHNDDWPAHVTPLRDRPPVTFEVEDPSEVCRYSIGQPFESDIFAVWDLGSPVSRPGARLSAVFED
jgi:hypothetical protein